LAPARRFGSKKDIPNTVLPDFQWHCANIGFGETMASISNTTGGETRSFSLLSNPFILLGISPNATPQNIKNAYEDAVEDGIANVEVLRRAQQELLTPRLRIHAEVGGLVDVAPDLASRLISWLQAGASRAKLTESIASLHALPKSNILAHLATHGTANENDLINLLNAQCNVSIGGTCDAINDARDHAGIVRTDQDSVAQALAAVQKGQVKSVVDRAATNDSFSETFTSFVRKVLATTDAGLITKLAIYIDAYGQAMAPVLSLRREAVIAACEAVRSNPKSSQLIERIARELHRWNDIAHPLKLFESHMNREDTQARDLFMQVRDTCIWLANEQQAYDAARSIKQCCSEVFKELPRAIEQMREEIQTLSQLSQQKAAADLLAPLYGVLSETDKNHSQLERELLRTGFGSRSNGLVKKLYGEFAKAVRITVGTEIADLPWRLVRSIAISLNNDSQSPDAAARLVDGLVSYFAVQRPSDDVVVTLKNDQEAIQKNILQRDLVSNLKQGKLGAADKIAESLVIIEKDSEELAALKEMRDKIAAKRRSKFVKGVAWLAGAGVLALFITVGSQEKSSGRSASSNYSPPSYSPPSYSPPSSQPPTYSPPSYSPPSYSPAPTPRSTPSERVDPPQATYAEERPPVSTGLTFNRANIRYCVFQNVRLEAARSVVVNNADVGRFNSFIDDWNSRCSQYKYRPSDRNAVLAEVSGRQSILEAEGRALFRRS
jgi:hypothetical protein